jgi:hypothetical protein
VLGTFIGLVALIIAIGGRCTGPDRTLVCSSLHILAGNYLSIKPRLSFNHLEIVLCVCPTDIKVVRPFFGPVNFVGDEMQGGRVSE